MTTEAEYHAFLRGGIVGILFALPIAYAVFTLARLGVEAP